MDDKRLAALIDRLSAHIRGSPDLNPGLQDDIAEAAALTRLSAENAALEAELANARWCVNHNADLLQEHRKVIAKITASNAALRKAEIERWEQFAQNAENMQNQAPYKHQPGWKYACCQFSRMAFEIRDDLRALAACDGDGERG